MGDGTKYKPISEIYESKEESDLEKLTLNGISKEEDRNGDVVCDISTSDLRLTTQVEALTDTEKGEIIGSPDADAETKQQCSDGIPPSTGENAADHKAVSRTLRKRKHEKDTACRICGKIFPSLKSLYGHMRCHTRDWRGVSPPPTANTLEPMPATDPNSCNTVFPLSNWSVNSKRSGKEKAPIDPKYEEESEDPVINAAKNLLFLANGGFSRASTVRRQQQHVDMSSTKPTKKIDDLQILTALAAEQKQYFCTICNKSFSSPQALGGHAASHNKNKSVGTLEGAEEAKLAQTEGLIGQDGLPMKASEHRCNICGLAFPTGQALGGHKRKHWPGPENVVAPSPENVIAPSPENAEKESHPLGDIDLNVPAQPEVE